jgi:hypothetical protein
LPYQDPTRLVTAFGTRPDLAQSQRRGYVSYLTFLDWRARSRAFSSIVAYDVRAGFTGFSSTRAETRAEMRLETKPQERVG